MKCYTDSESHSDYFDDLDVFEEAELDSDSDEEPLRCLDCNLLFVSKNYLYRHLLNHIKQPYVKLEKVQLRNPPLRITFKNRTGHRFEIVSPRQSPLSLDTGYQSSSLEETPRNQGREDFYDPQVGEETENYEDEHEEGSIEGFDEDDLVDTEQTRPEENRSFEDLEGSSGNSPANPELAEVRGSHNFSPNLAEVIGGAFLTDLDSPFDEHSPERTQSGEGTENAANVEALSSEGQTIAPHYGGIPGAQPTPPPEPSPTGVSEYPKIKIKTTGLFKDPEPRSGCTITEITESDSSDGPSSSSTNNATPVWPNPGMDDPLKLPDSENLLSMFNSDRSNKDIGYSTGTDNEFISLDTFNERNCNAMQLYNPSSSSAVATTSSLDSLTGLPMQALAQQVSRLNPSAGQGLHQQNVLINIQQFPTQPQQQYQAPHGQMPQHQPMYPAHYPAQPAIHQPYGYQPPPYPPYPPAQGFPSQHPRPAHMAPPPHQMGPMAPPPAPMGQMQPPQMGPQPINASGQPPNPMVPSSQSQPMPPPSQPPNSMQGGYRAPMPPHSRPPVPRGAGGLRAPMGNRSPGVRPRAPIIRPRGTGPCAVIRGPTRPRITNLQNGQRPSKAHSVIKRESNQGIPGKRRRVDVLTPSDKDDDDCQVICIQQKNSGLPQIENVHGGPESVENSIMKLSDSITLSVRNPPPKPADTPQKSDAKAVANVLASRGITVTASGKSKESPTKQMSSSTALSLNGAVSIVAKNLSSTSKSPTEESIPTVDLTDDCGSASQSKKGHVLPYRCDLCAAQYPNAAGLSKHRQVYHKTSMGMCELGVPLINMKQPGILQRLGQLGINNYIPLSSGDSNGTFALPIINSKNPGNVAALGATQMLTLGPVRSIPKPTTANNAKKESVAKTFPFTK
uniref:C2H2-type domain-containing protein n=1 Tax=Dendroctonus ponderosae TaxID=77166 RepID=A0AAR5QJ63_DENPD